MQNQKILAEIRDAVETVNLKGFKNGLATLVSEVGISDASEELAKIFYQNYTRFKAEVLSVFLKAVIKHDARIAMEHHPENSLFKLIVTVGSKDMYDCYIEEAIIPFLKVSKTTEPDLFYAELLNTAETISASSFSMYVECIKGMDYNSAFGSLDDEGTVLQIYKTDYEILEDVTAKYNTIIGRRIIIEDLNIKFMS